MNNEITIYTEKGNEIYTFNRINLAKLEKEYPLESKGYKSFVHSKRQENILDLIKKLLNNKSAERDISDLANDIDIVSAKVREYLHQINYDLSHLKQIKNI